MAKQKTDKQLEKLNIISDNVTRDYQKQCIVRTKIGEYFRFPSRDQMHLTLDSCDRIYKHWDEFESDASWNLEKLRNEYKDLLAKYPLKFPQIPECTEPDKLDILDMQLLIWEVWAKIATDRTAKPVSSKKGKLSTRIYTLLDADSKVKTPQAVACIKIMSDLCDKEKHTISETDLKAAIYSRRDELKTRQDPWRIFQYYRPQLIASKNLKHD